MGSPFPTGVAGSTRRPACHTQVSKLGLQPWGSRPLSAAEPVVKCMNQATLPAFSEKAQNTNSLCPHLCEQEPRLENLLKQCESKGSSHQPQHPSLSKEQHSLVLPVSLNSSLDHTAGPRTSDPALSLPGHIGSSYGRGKAP